ncbi:MAG: hypothetical protein ABUL72_00740, partial [Armatimonadota bacterium]
LKRHPSGVIIDCSQLTLMTPEGAETFHSTIKFVHLHKEARVVVAAVPEGILEVLRSVPDVRSQLPIAATVQEARRSLDLLVQEHETKKKRGANRSYQRKILACACPGSADEYLLRVVSDLVDKDKSKVILLIPILVPRELPLQSPLPDVEESAATYATYATKMLESEGVGHEIIVERARDFATLVMDTANEIDAAHVVLGLPGDHEMDQTSAKMFKSLIERVTRPLIFTRGKVSSPSPVVG